MLTPFQYQTDALDGLREGFRQGKRRGLLCMLMGAGKAQPMHSLILTPSGWRKMSAINAGDAIIDPMGSTSQVTGVFPQGHKDTYRVTFRDGASAECCADHLWFVNRPHRAMLGLPGRARPLHHLMDDLFDENGNARWFVPMTHPVDMNKERLPVSPYLLGVLLGDGSLASDGVSLSTADEEMLSLIDPYLPAGITAKKNSSLGCDYRITGPRTGGKPNALLDAIRELGLDGADSFTKHIPTAYLSGLAEDRLALLQGLLDTDGSASPGKSTVEYTTTSERMSREVIDIVRSLGGTATRASRLTFYRHAGERRDGAVSWRIHLKLPGFLSPFRLTRKASRHAAASKYQPSRAIVSVEPSGRAECQCISVSAYHGLYVTDNYIVTHNTKVAMDMMRLTAEKGKRSLFLCDRRMLAEQSVERAISEDLDAGLLMAGRGTNREAPCQFASKQTLDSWLSRGQIELPRFDLIVTDECHRAVSDTWEKLRKRWPNSYHVGLTATPCLGNGNGMGAYYDFLVQPIKPSGLRELGRIVPVRAFAPHTPDLTGVKSGKDGDYAPKALARAMSRANMVGDRVGWWRRLADGRPSLYFGCDVSHALAIRDEFNADGVPAEIIHADSPDDERADIQRRLKNGSLMVVTNCDVLAEGIDWPFVSCIGLVRPTKRLRRYLQNSGRGMRSFDGKEDMVLIDHAGCVLYHGFPDRDIDWPLDPNDNVDKMNRKPANLQTPFACVNCSALIQGTNRCPECGHVHKAMKVAKDYGSAGGTLVEATREELPPEEMKTVKQNYWYSCIGTAIKRFAKAGMAAGMFAKKFGVPPWEAGVGPLPHGRGDWQRPAVEVFPGFRRAK